MFENVKADIQRLNPDGKVSFRTFLRCLLSQGFQAILVYRFFNWLHRKGIPGQPFRFICERFIEITTGISIPAQCQIGKGFRIHHFGGIIFHPTVRIGENCTLYHGVTIGDRGGSGGAAVLGDHVLIGAGAKIIGEVTIGNNCTIGANTVVTKDIPSGHVATGSPCCLRELPAEKIIPLSRAKEIPAIPRVMDLRGTYKGGGGPDKTILNSAAQHDSGRVHVLVTYLRQPEDHEFQIPEMAASLGINYTDLYDRRGIDLKCLLALRRLLKEHHLTLLHAHDDKTLLYGWLLKLITPGLNIMYTCHSHAVHQREDFQTRRAFFKFKMRQRIQIFLMKRYAGPILTISQDTRDRLIANGLEADSVAVLYNGIDIRHWASGKGRPVLREELDLAADALVVGTVARITQEKDLPTFYAVAKKVVQEFPETVFLVVGDGYGDELEQAKREIASEGLQDVVRFTGHRSDLLDVYASLDIFLMTSLTEGLPNTLLEAMAMGLPCIATQVGGIPEVVENGISGMLGSAGDAEVLSRHILTLIKNKERRDGLAKSARERVEAQFDFSQRVRAMEDYYARFAGLPSTPSEWIPTEKCA